MSGSNKVYRELTEEENRTQRELIKTSWRYFLQRNDPTLTEEDYFINEYNLLEAVERVSKRKFYYKVFHGIEHLSEFKEAALLCFWLCKLKPFVVLKADSPLCASTNELFAVHLITSLLKACSKKAERFRYPDRVTIKNFVYALKYQDLTKEALIQYMECLAMACGIDVHDVNGTPDSAAPAPEDSPAASGAEDQALADGP